MLIFTARTKIAQTELIHVLMSGVRVINLNLGLRTPDELEDTIKTMDSAINIFKSQSKFNFEVTKVGAMRGRNPRIGRMKNDEEWSLCQGSLIVLTCDKRYQYCSTNEVSYVSNFRRFIPELRCGDEIRIGWDIVLKVVKIAMSCYVTCRVIHHDSISSHQNVLLPPFEDLASSPTEEEIEDCAFAVNHRFDFLMAPLVNRPEHFRLLKGLIGDAPISLIAQIESNLELERAHRIIEHFDGVFVCSTSQNVADLIDKTRKDEKFVIAGFPKARSLDERSIWICEAADRLLLTSSSCTSKVVAASAKLTKILKNGENIRSGGGEQECILLNCIVESSDKEEMVQHGACLAEREDVAGKIFESKCPAVLLVSSPSLARHIQMSRRCFEAMVYVECDATTWKERIDNYLQTAALYGRDTKIFKTDELIVTDCAITPEPQ